MRRRFLLVWLFGGCDLVIPLTEPADVSCGPYRSITAVAFDPALADVSDFSIHYNGTQAMVRATVTPPGQPRYTGPVPVKLDGETWVFDAARFANLAQFQLDGGHLLGDGSMFGWRDRVEVTGAPPVIHAEKG